MWDFILACAKSLFPPMDGNPQGVFRHQVAVSLALGGLIVAISTHIALACGFLPSLFAGFADAQTLYAMQSQVAQVELTQLDTKITDDRREQCKAAKNQNGLAMTYIGDRIREELNQYYALAKYEYRLPSCDEIGQQ